MIVTTYFSAAGIPKTGLSPTVNIRRLDTNALVVTAGVVRAVVYYEDLVALSNNP